MLSAERGVGAYRFEGMEQASADACLGTVGRGATFGTRVMNIGLGRRGRGVEGLSGVLVRSD